MKLKFDIENKKVDLEADVEKLVEKGMEQHDKNWEEKFDLKHSAKKEIMEIKHSHKLEEEKMKKSLDVDIKLEYEREKEKNSIEKLERKSKNRIKIASIIMFFIYGIFCIVGFNDAHTIAAVISLIQIIFVLISIFTSMGMFKLFKNDYKIFFILSIIMIMPWLTFAV